MSAYDEPPGGHFDGATEARLRVAAGPDWPRRSGMSAEQTSPMTEEGRVLLSHEAMNARSFPLITAEGIIAIEAEARQQALTDAIAAVEVIETHEAHAFEPGVEWLCVTSGDPPRSRDCGNDAAHYRLIDRDAVIDTLTRLRDGS